MLRLSFLFTVVTRLELPGLRREIETVDARALVVRHAIGDAVGGMLKRRPLH